MYSFWVNLSYTLINAVHCLTFNSTILLSSLFPRRYFVLTRDLALWVFSSKSNGIRQRAPYVEYLKSQATLTSKGWDTRLYFLSVGHYVRCYRPPHPIAIVGVSYSGNVNPEVRALIIIIFIIAFPFCRTIRPEVLTRVFKRQYILFFVSNTD